jgi:hypothetical protein
LHAASRAPLNKALERSMITVRQVRYDEWREDRAEVWLCTFPLKPIAFAERLNLTFSRELDQLGEIDVAVASIDGSVVLFQARTSHAGPPDTEFVSAAARGDVQHLERLLQNLCNVSGVSRNDLLWVESDLGPRPWALLRLDDNGNLFLMSLFRDRNIAEQMAVAYERKEHKQTYIVEAAL